MPNTVNIENDKALSQMTKDGLMKLKRDQLLTNCQKRGIDTASSDGSRVTKAILTQKLLDHVETMLEDEGQVLDETIYESCNEEIEEEEEEEAGEGGLHNTQQNTYANARDQRNRSNTDPTVLRSSIRHQPNSEMSQLTNMFKVLLNKMDQPNNNQQNQQYNQQAQQQPFYEDQTFQQDQGYHQQMSSSRSMNFEPQVTFEETLQEKIYQVSSSGSTRLLLRRHPHLESLPTFGFEYTKDLKQMLDWTLVRCICMWEPEKIYIPHKQTLLQACARVPQIESEEFELRKTRQPQGSVLVRLINAVDAFYESSRGNFSRRHQVMSLPQLDQLLMNFQNSEVYSHIYPAKSAGRYVRTGSQSSSRSSGTNTCNAYNSSRGCSKSATTCIWPHFCNRCIKKGKEESHPGFRCTK